MAMTVCDQVAVLAVIAWQSPTEQSVSKSRLYYNELVGTTCLSIDLYRLIRQEAQEKFHGSYGVESVAVYDKSCSDYIFLKEDEELDILRRFGARIRVLIRLDAIGEKLEEPLKAIAGRFYPYDSSQGIEICGNTIKVEEMTNEHNTGTGVNIWDGAVLLAKYLENRPSVVSGKSVLELGAGCGLVGIVAGVLGASQVTLTDLPYVIPLMKRNVERHGDILETSGCSMVTCEACDWFSPLDFADDYYSQDKQVSNSNRLDMILLADCVWVQELVAPLLTTIKMLLSRAPSCMVLISYQQRGKPAHEEFWAGLHDLFSKIDEVDVKELGLTKPDSLHVLECYQ